MNYPFLQGVRVIESSAFIAAPLAGLTLAQMGAEVIRIDLIGGGIDYARMPLASSGRSLYWTGLNKQKKSIAIDIRRSEGRELVQQLVAAPDAGGGVLLTNIGTPWLSHATLSKLREDIITCTIQGNFDGTTAVDYTVNCATGYPFSTGSVQEPVNSVFPGWDACCAYQAAFAIVSAVMARRQSGSGAELKLALSDVAFSMLSHLGVMTEAEVLKQERQPIGNYIYGAFGRDFATKDGQRIMVAGISKGQWKSLVRACGIGQSVAALEMRLNRKFDDESDIFECREDIASLLEPWFDQRNYAEVVQIFTREKVCWGPYRNVQSLINDDVRVGAENPMYERITTAGVGEHWAAGTPINVVGEERAPIEPAALLGQHTHYVLASILGLNSDTIGRLHDAGVVAGPEADPTT